MNPELLKRSLEELSQGENGASAAIQCDKCSRIEVYRPNTTIDDIQTIEGFMDTKTYFADQGWQVSLGYDLCPDCVGAVPA